MAAWIRTIETIDAARGELRRSYDRLAAGSTAGPGDGRIDAVLTVHSLNVPSLNAHHQLYRTLMHGRSALTRVQREMIAVAVSSANGCRY